MKRPRSRGAPYARLAACLLLFACSAVAARPQYRLVRELPLPGDEGWDYLTFEQGGHRLFVAHGSRVLVIDTDLLRVTGEIADTPGVHGIALAPDLGRGYVSAGRANSIVVFDLATLARLQEIKVSGENPDAILYDGATHRVFSFNGRGLNVTAVDARSGEVVGSIALDAKPEFAVSDGAGHLYVNLEDKASIAAIDAVGLKLASLWPIAGCEEPSGLAFDASHQRLFSGCGNGVMVVVDARTGQSLGSASIGQGVDAVKYDPGARLAFASCGGGEGELTAVAVSQAGAPEVAQALATRRGARTMALDERSHRIFLVTANFGPAPAATPGQAHPRPAIVPGSFRLLVVDPYVRAMTTAPPGGRP